MTIELVPQLNVAIPEQFGYMDLRERAITACASVRTLEMHGSTFDRANEEEREIAAMLAEAYAIDPDATSKKIGQTRASEMTAPTIVTVAGILDAFGMAIAENSFRIRNMITNKLIIETENPDPRVRIRALELLGKISDIGLFTEKQELTIHTKSSEELRQNLRNKLAKLVDPDEEIVEGELVDDSDDSDDSDESEED